MDHARSEDDIDAQKRKFLEEQEELTRLIAAAEDELLQQGGNPDTPDPDQRETAEDHGKPSDEDGR